MEYRKLISFGKSSFVISLPKTWVNQNKLNKGDPIYLEEKNTELILSAKEFSPYNENKEETIFVDGKDISQIKREVVSAYIRNCKTINLTGNEIKDKAQELQQIIQSLVALEVMEQTSKKIIAKDFLNINDVSTKSIIRKIDVIIRSMLDDCEKMFEEDTYESINFRDNDINKLTFLMFRIIRFGLENPLYMMKKFNLSAVDLLKLWWLSYDLEYIGDEVKRVARYMRKIKFDKKKQAEFVTIIKDIQDSYLKMMKAYYDNNANLAHEVINSREEMIKRCETFYQENRQVEGIGFLVDKAKGSMMHIVHVGKVIYQ